MKYCNKCGAEIKGKEKFCRKCGAKLDIPKKESKKEENKLRHKDTQKVKEKAWKTYLLYAFLALLVLSLAFTSYQYYYFQKEYNAYYSKFKYEESEKERYVNLYNTEKQNKESEIDKRRQTESQLSDAQATIQAKSTEISGLRGTLSEEQSTRSSLQTELSTAEQTLSSQSQQLQTVQKEVQDIVYTINRLETFVKDSAELPNNILTKIHGLCGSPIEQSGDTCIINANKMGSDMNYCIDFTWTDDKTTSNFADGQRIFDVNTFWQSKEGDCDDFGFFMAAWLRSEYKIAKSICSNIKVQVKNGGLFSSPTYVNCPCDFYAVGGCYSGRSSCHMETGIGPSTDVYSSSSFVYNMHVVEPQNGGYDGYAPNNFDGGVNWIFTYDDFLILSNNRLYQSISGAKDKIESIS